MLGSSLTALGVTGVALTHTSRGTLTAARGAAGAAAFLAGCTLAVCALAGCAAVAGSSL
nr:hypothetical protein [Listeria monocytogenes]